MVSILLDNNLLKKNKGPFERRQGLTINWVCVTQNCYYRATTFLWVTLSGLVQKNLASV
jgi:hypothetical protein